MLRYIRQALEDTNVRAVVAGIYLWNKTKWPSTTQPIPQILFILATIFCGVHVVVYIVLACLSGQGGTTEVEKRKHVSTLVLIHLINLLVEAVFYSLGVWQIVQLYMDSANNVMFRNFVAVITWCSILLFGIVFELIDWIRHFDPHGRVKYAYYETFFYGNGDDKTEAEKKELITDMHRVSGITFTKLMRKITNFEKTPDDDEKKHAIDSVSSAVADFCGDLDLTLSDVAMGLMLLRWQSNQWIGGQTPVRADLILAQTDPVLNDVAAPLYVDSDDPFTKLDKNWLHISRLKRYSHLVNAAYGWIFYYSQNPCDCTALNRLCSKLSWGNKKAPRKQFNFETGISGPGGCLCSGTNCYLAAFLEMTHLISDDILLFDITEKFYEAAVMMVIDDATESIVIIIRGTLSGEDALVDMMGFGESVCEDADLADIPLNHQFIAHGGMLRTARNLSKRIVGERWVQEARQHRPHYPLVLCGHSLGAGLASLMAVLLKPMFPELKAYAFSPPGALMNENLADYSHDYIVSLIYGYDCVGRLGGPTLEDLRARLFHALCVFKVPKFIALSSRILVSIMGMIPLCGRYLPNVGNMESQIDGETQQKLIYPDLEDVFETRIGSKLKPHLRDRVNGSTSIDRILPDDRSLMNWKLPQCQHLLILPRPYPRSLYTDRLITVDTLLESIERPISSARILFIFEVDKDFAVDNVQPFQKKGYKPPPVALWANPYTFNTLLIHPMVFFHHSPIYVSTALDRLYNEITFPDRIYPKVHMNTWYSEVKPFANRKREPEEYTDDHCRIRKLK